MTNAELGLSCDHLNGERGVTQKIKQAMHDAAKQFVYIGFLLWEVREYEYYYENNYANVYEYAEVELGFKRSSTKNFIAICENFCKKNERFSRLPTMFLDERWSDYQYSQLTEMLAMSSKQREQTQPTMTVKQLREMKKAPKVEQVTIDELKVESTGQTSGRIKEPTIEEIEKENQRLTELYCTEANLVDINGEQTQITHYIMEELCRLAGIKYIDYEDYEITIKIKEE